jgi:very-short-patch-repair endonuclease
MADSNVERTIRPWTSTAQRRSLRRVPTDAERLLWSHLRSRQIGDFKFRRQHAVGPYVLDFYCPAARLGIEVDGSQHYEARGQHRDVLRTHYLDERGVNVMRFSDRDVLTNVGGVIEALSEALTLTLSHQMGEAIFRTPDR